MLINLPTEGKKTTLDMANTRFVLYKRDLCLVIHEGFFVEAYSVSMQKLATNNADAEVYEVDVIIGFTMERTG